MKIYHVVTQNSTHIGFLVRTLGVSRRDKATSNRKKGRRVDNKHYFEHTMSGKKIIGI